MYINFFFIFIDHIDNQWMAIPFTVQIRTLLFNSTTFENCKLFNKNLELHLPPVIIYILFLFLFYYILNLY